MTDGERDLHEQAIRVRRMTDQQLVEHLQHIRDDAYAVGYAEAEAQASSSASGKKTLTGFIEELSNGRCKGVKSATAFKIEEFARAEGYVE